MAFGVPVPGVQSVSQLGQTPSLSPLKRHGQLHQQDEHYLEGVCVAVLDESQEVKHANITVS